MKLNTFSKLIIAVGISFLPGIIGFVFTAPAIPEWYAFIQKPVLTPPSWIFGPVWTALYLLMGIAAFVVWTRISTGLRERKRALVIFDVHLALNALWSILFFGFRNPGVALIEIIVLWLSILLTIFVFYKASRLAAVLLVPYILWVSFAVYLNYAVWVLN
ncbi:MAG: tryptophan-rich sensory protein [Candidatus Azambacteria bacterium]|nr:tryptophan-rich sensory protein [Candidatus Azambacteria bacterium]